MVLASSFPGTVVTKDHMLGDFKPQTLVFSRFWRPDVQNQSVGGALPPRKVLGEGPPSLLAALVPTSVPRLWPRGSSLSLHGHPASSSLGVFSVSLRLVSLCLATVRTHVVCI